MTVELESSRLWTRRRLSQGPNIPKVFILNPMNDTTVRLFMYVQVVEKGDWRGLLMQAVLLPFGATSQLKTQEKIK